MKNPELALANMRVNCKRDLPWFIEQSAHARELIVVCGGPSLENNLRHVRARKKIGGWLIACNGAGQFLIEQGIIPDVIAFVDPSPVVHGFIRDTPKQTSWMLASICHPTVFGRLSDKRVVVWHADCGYEEQRDILDCYPEKPSSLIGGGNTIGLRMLNVGYLMGYRRMHFYGLDGSYADDGSDHAYEKHDGPEPDEERSDAWFNGKQYFGSKWMFAQSGLFIDEFYPKFVALGCKIWVHGEGLIPDACREFHRLERVAA